jgi:hypothetical protein
MSELASAAYTVQKDDWRNPEKRKLRFQSGAIPFVVTSCTYEKGTPFFHGTRNGRGLLGVIDFNRIDLPAPVITEDVVKLEPNGDFTLLGRAKLAPLKGCSLLAADGIGSMSQRSAGWSPTANDGIFSLAAFRKPRQQILQTLTKFLESEVAACALARDIGSNAAARFALRDALEAAKHLRGDALFEALRQSRATDWMESGKDQPMRLLMIPPNTHPIALLHPLALALCADFHAVVRLPRNQESPRSFTVELLNHLQRSGINVGTLGSQFRLGSAGQRLSQEGFTATLVFGNDDTIQEIRNVSSMRVFGHGGALTASVASWEEIPSQIEAVISDTFALMQEGCMASRLLGLVIPNDLPVDTAVTILSGALEKCWWRVWGEPLSPLHSGGLITHGLVATSPGLPAIVVKEKASPALYGPVLNVGLLRGNHGLADLFSWPDQWPQLKMLTVSPGLLALLERKFGELRQDKLTVRPLGTANKPAWNGLHFGRPVFS